LKTTIFQSPGLPVKYIVALLTTFTATFLAATTGGFPVAWLVAVVAGWSLNQLRQQRELILLAIVVLLVFQNFLIGVGAHLAGNDQGLTFLTQVPLLFTAGLFVGGPLKTIRWDWVTRLFLGLLGIALGSLAFGHGSLGAIIANLRNLTFFFMVYQIAWQNSRLASFDVAALCRRLSHLAFLIIGVGVVLLLGGYRAYAAIGIDEVYRAKGATALAQAGLDGRFYSDAFGHAVTRMGSLYYEPVNLGYLLVGMLLFLVMFRWTQSWVVRVLSEAIVLVGVFLTFGKGALMVLGLALLAPGIHRSLKWCLHFLNDRAIYLGVMLLVAGLVYLYSNFYYQTFGGAVGNHFTAITETWQNILARPLGHGLGTGGNAAAALNVGESDDATWLSTGGETALLSFGYQIGLVGIGILSLIFVQLGRQHLVHLNSLTRRVQASCLQLAYLPVILIIMSIFQDNTFTPQCIAVYMMLLAMGPVLRRPAGEESP